ncbi:MAG: hypothetical protein AAFR61_31330 [Bacteroidota bacterium]
MGVGQKKLEINFQEDLNVLIERFFKIELERLNITKEQISIQSVDELTRSLENIDIAISKASLFGKLKVNIIAEGLVVLAKSSSGHLLEFGILPLLLESKNLALKRLAELGGDPIQVEKDLSEKAIKDLRSRIKYLSTFLKVIIGVLAWILCGIAAFTLPRALDWAWLIDHKNSFGLTCLFLVVAGGITWIILDKDPSRRWFAFGSIIIAAFIAAITIL